MRIVADEEMLTLLATVRSYTAVILGRGPRFEDETSPTIIWEHGRRNLGLRNDGILAVVLPVADGSDVCGLCVFTTDIDETRTIMNADPAVQAGVLTFETHACGGFPGDALP